MKVYVGIGSNVDPDVHIPNGLRRLSAATRVLAVSPFYRTSPVGPAGQPPFWNGAALVETDAATPMEFREGTLRTIERAEGRVRSADRYAPRELDLDILLWGDLADAAAGIPDPDILTRPYLVRCLLDLDAQLVLPGDKLPLTARLTPEARALERVWP